MHRHVVAFIALAACAAPVPDAPEPAVPTVPIDSTAPVDSAVVIDTAPTDTAPPVDTGTGSAVDCSVLPPVPVANNELTGYFGAEDFDFDHDGYAVAVDGGNLVGRDRYGAAKIVASGVAGTASGTRLMHDGTWLVADQSDGALRRVDPVTGTKTVVYSGAWPNGIEVDGDDVYLSDFSLGTVVRFDVNDPQGTKEVIDNGLASPNGVVLSPDGQTLYVVLSSTSSVLAYDRQADGTWGDSRGFHDRDGGSYQGINVDICGNVYVSDIDRIVRVTPDGLRQDLVMLSGYLPNMRWGQGVGGFDATVLYGIDWGADSLWSMEIGIPGKPHVMGP